MIAIAAVLGQAKVLCRAVLVVADMGVVTSPAILAATSLQRFVAAALLIKIKAHRVRHVPDIQSGQLGVEISASPGSGATAAATSAVAATPAEIAETAIEAAQLIENLITALEPGSPIVATLKAGLLEHSHACTIESRPPI